MRIESSTAVLLLPAESRARLSGRDAVDICPSYAREAAQEHHLHGIHITVVAILFVTRSIVPDRPKGVRRCLTPESGDPRAPVPLRRRTPAAAHRRGLVPPVPRRPAAPGAAAAADPAFSLPQPEAIRRRGHDFVRSPGIRPLDQRKLPRHDGQARSPAGSATTSPAPPAELVLPFLLQAVFRTASPPTSIQRLVLRRHP